MHQIKHLLFASLIAVLIVPICPGDEPGRTLVVAHRGLLQHAPENTLANFRACLELRLGFEFDVQKTKDGHLICIHDDTLDRTTNGTGHVAEMNLSEIRQLDAGSWFDSRFAGEKVPTIEEVLKLIAEYQAHDVLVAVDLKGDGVAAEVVRLAEKHKALRHLIFIGQTISDSQVRARIKKTSELAQTATVANSAAELTSAIEAANSDWVYLRFIPTKTQMEAVRQSKKRAFVAGATVSGHQIENWRMATHAGVDAILTDYALELRTLIRIPASE